MRWRFCFMRVLRAYRTWPVILIIVAGAIAGSAQNMQYNTRGDEGMTAQYVKTGLYVISGRGSNSVVRLSANGLILVDGKLPGGYDALLAQVKRISKQPIRALVLTDGDESRTGTNAKFLEDGTAIVVQENARQYQIHLGGVEAQLLHFGNAHTNSDTVVYFPNLKAVAVGDLFAPTPIPDFSAGGSLVGWGPVLAEVLKLDFDVVVPGTGPTVTRADLQAYKTRIDTLVSRATGLVKNGVPKDQLLAQLKTDDLGWQFSFTGDQLDRFYAELSQTK